MTKITHLALCPYCKRTIRLTRKGIFRRHGIGGVCYGSWMAPKKPEPKPQEA